MPGSSSAPQASGATRPRLRSSCDSCGFAKVRCDRARPACRRCVALGLTCVYGISRRFGRPPRGRLHAGVTPTGVTGVSGEKHGLRPDNSLHNFPDVDLELPRPVQGEVLSALSDPRTTAFPIGINTGAQNQGIYDCDDTSLGLFDPMFGEEWPQLDIWIPTPSPKDSTAASRSQPRREQSPRDSHSCARESYEILADLICPAPDLHAPCHNSDTVTAQLDHVLHFTRKASDRLSHLLECSCAKSGHRVMIHASIISRILIWYQQAAGWTCSISSASRPHVPLDTTERFSGSTSPSSTPNEVAGLDTPSLQTLPQTTGFVVADVPAALGTFSIDDQRMQGAIRNQLVLSELSKMSTLIELFGSHFSVESSNNGMASLYTYTAAWLQTEYSKTVRHLKAAGPALDEIADT